MDADEVTAFLNHLASDRHVAAKQNQALAAQLTGTPWLMVSLLYGAGLRLSECLSLARRVPRTRRMAGVG